MLNNISIGKKSALGDFKTIWAYIYYPGPHLGPRIRTPHLGPMWEPLTNLGDPNRSLVLGHIMH